jgi:ParB/RepB/Spo0J family partition protein
VAKVLQAGVGEAPRRHGVAGGVRRQVQPEEQHMAEMQLELGQLQRKYSSLRIKGSVDTLVASMATVGQQTPVLVVGGAEDGAKPILIDGYRRVRALGRLKCDTVRALHLDMAEAEALVLRHQQAVSSRPTALEDGWLLAELLGQHGCNQRELAQRLQRSPAWVSGRLGLVRELPDSLQIRVRSGKLPAHAAARHLLAFARANRKACEELTSNLGERAWTTREIAALWQQWQRGNGDQRQKLLAQPQLFVKTQQAMAPTVPADPAATVLLRGLNRLAQQAEHVHRLTREQQAEGRSLAMVPELCAGWRRAQQAWSALEQQWTRSEVGHA